MSGASPYLAPGALASGLLLSLSLPNLEFWPLAWVALVPLLLAIEGCGPADAARLGFAAGLVHAATIIYWVAYTMHTYGGLPWVAGVAVMFVLAAYLALYPAAWAVGLASVAGRRRSAGGPLPLATLLLAAPLWVALEWLRSWLLTGFPWMLLGYSQYRQLPVIQVADLGGVYAVSFLVLAGNVAAYALVRALTAKGRAGATAAVVAAVAALIGGSLAYGRTALARVEAAAAAGPSLPVGIVQGNVEQGVKWEPAYQAATLEVYRAVTAELAAAGVRLVVWPETAVPAFFQTDPSVRPVVLATARAAGVDLLFGAPSAELRPPARAGEEPGVVLFNSAYLVGADGGVRGRYDKQHLVPFGEYVPLPGLLFFVNRLVEGIGDFGAGHGMPVIAAGPARLGVLICYEAIFPDLARRVAADGVTILVNITNDAWFGRTAAPRQHLAQAALRAAELKLPLVRAANTGVSAIIAPTGRIEKTLGLFTRGSLAGTIPLPATARSRTLYARVGDRFAQGCALVAASLLVAAAWRVRSSRETTMLRGAPTARPGFAGPGGKGGVGGPGSAPRPSRWPVRPPDSGGDR